MSEEENSLKSTFLTPRQLEIMKLRQKGFNTEAIAREIGTTRQNVTILEKRAHRNLDRAIGTLSAVRDMKISTDIEIPRDTHMLDAVKQIVASADKFGIRLNDNLIGIMTKFKVAMERDLRGGVTQRPITVLMFQDGRIQFV